jgi:hypothetical protein
MYFAILKNSGGELDRIEAPTVEELRSKVAAEWIPIIDGGDTIAVVEVAGETFLDFSKKKGTV